MIIKGSGIPEVGKRKDYGVSRLQEKIKHFAVRLTTPENPFVPHKHEVSEFWYILDGNGIVSLDGKESAVEAGDLIVLQPWVTHGLRSETEVRWICFG